MATQEDHESRGAMAECRWLVKTWTGMDVAGKEGMVTAPLLSSEILGVLLTVLYLSMYV